MAIFPPFSEGGSTTEGGGSSGLVFISGFIGFLETVVLEAWHDPGWVPTIIVVNFSLLLFLFFDYLTSDQF